MPNQTITVGQFELTSMPVQPESLRPTQQFFPSADLTALETVRTELPSTFGSSAGELRFGQSLCVLRDVNSVTLVDAGLPATLEGWPLLDGLSELGIAPDGVTRETRMVHRNPRIRWYKDRSERLFALLVIASRSCVQGTTVWAVRVGEFSSSLTRIPLKKNGSPPKSVFRMGLDTLRQILLFGCAGRLVLDGVVPLLSSR